MEAFLFFECLTLAILGSRFGVRRHGKKKIYNFFLTVTVAVTVTKNNC